MWLTWKHQTFDFTWPLAFDQKVEIFYEQAFGWQLHMADLMANGGQLLGEEKEIERIPHSGFAVLHVCLSYFETIGHHEHNDPGWRDADYFKAGVRSVFPSLGSTDPEFVEALLSVLYKGARCGLYHNSMTAPNVGLGQPPQEAPIGFDSVAKVLVISPERLPRALKAHLNLFRTRLLDSSNAPLRANFERRFDQDTGLDRGQRR